MKCDRCNEQLPVADGIEHFGQTLCLDCALRGCNPWPEKRTQGLEDVGFGDQKLLTSSLSTTGGGK